MEITLFLVENSFDGFVTAKILNRNAKAIKIPRIEVASCESKDLSSVGVYFLFCKEDNETDAVYIGEAENIKERLLQHIRDFDSKKEDFYWNTAVIFTGEDLDKALIRYLENELVKIAKDCKHYKILTKKTYQNTVINDSKKAGMAEFIEELKIIIKTLGYNVLESPNTKNQSTTKLGSTIFIINTGKAKAEGKITTEGFVVLKNSVINDKFSNDHISSIRQKYIDMEKVKDLKLQDDITFSSPSSAASFVLGYAVNGCKFWKTQDGKTFNEVEESEIK